MKKPAFLLFFCLLFVSLSFAQNLTVPQIMAEPSIAGMRPEAERLSPDGRKVVFTWNAEGKEPRNVYLWDGTGEPKIILRPSDLLPAMRPPVPENKLGYGVIMRDEFSRQRENQIGNIDWSPDSKKLLFTQNGDLWTMELVSDISPSGRDISVAAWKDLVEKLTRLTDLAPLLIKAFKDSGIQDQSWPQRAAEKRASLIAALEAAADPPAQPRDILELANELDIAVLGITRQRDAYPVLTSNQVFMGLVQEYLGVANRIKIARTDYINAIKTVSPALRRLTKTQSPEVFARWLDNQRIAFLQGGNVFVIDTDQFSLIQLTRDANPAAFVGVQNSTPSKDGSLMAYVVSDSSRQRALVVPNYLDEYVQAQQARRGWSEQRIFAVKTDGSTERPFEAKLPRSEGAGYIRGLRWAADNSSLIVDRIDKDLKRRQLFYIHDIGSKGEQVILVTEETDPKWIANLSRFVEPNPRDDSQIVFGSERDGYNHLYLATLERRKPEPNPGGEIRGENPSDAGFSNNVSIRQLTKGNFEVDWVKWQADGNELFYSSTEDGTEIREFYAIGPQPGATKVKVYTGDAKGMKSGAQIDDLNDGPEVLFTGSQWNKPAELFVGRFCTGCRGLTMPRQITYSTPEAFGKMAWAAPKFVDIPSKDGKVIKSKIYLPADHNPASIVAANQRSSNQRSANQTSVKKYPMVIFVHGAGYLQNTINGWNNYYREFMFNEMLAQKGYVVLDIDYRGSAGYGQAWRTDVYDFLGGPDMQDHVDAIDYAVKNYAVDSKRVGVYGGSYGGFMAEMLIFRAPDKVAAAAALRPVADWKNYYASSPIYTAERLGFPDKNPEAYKRSSPIAYADKLEKPLLILHGMQDDNVHVQDSVQLVEKLIRLGKTPYFETMFYPAENHTFTRPESWTDEYSRILTFFEKNLK
jgi:dipeptidyl aminopeptidase/acylaminoacyl peptidase